jgi:hypothetical protein
MDDENENASIDYEGVYEAIAVELASNWLMRAFKNPWQGSGHDNDNHDYSRDVYSDAIEDDEKDDDE